jgi:hypothetical protein
MKKILLGAVAAIAAIAVTPDVSLAQRGYATQTFLPQNRGSSVTVGTIADLTGPQNSNSAILQDLWVYPGGSDCSTDVLNRCEWIEHGKIYGTVGNYNGDSPTTAIPNYKGHFYAYNRCTDKCRFYQINYNGNIPANSGRNNYHISWANNTWYILLDDQYIQDLTIFGQLNYSKYATTGIEKQSSVYNYTNGLQFLNWRYKDLNNNWQTINGNTQNNDSGPYGMTSTFNGNGTVTFNRP